jgi:hypothetical protein
VAQVDVVIESGAAVDDNATCVYLFRVVSIELPYMR